ncbi:protein of unknown function (plasmid) [Caballeronia sp. S22]
MRHVFGARALIGERSSLKALSHKNFYAHKPDASLGGRKSTSRQKYKCANVKVAIQHLTANPASMTIAGNT